MQGKDRSFAFARLPACSIESLEARRLLSGFAAHVDFGPAAASAPAGYVADNGAVMGDRGNGLNYGWNVPHPAQVVEHHVRRGSNGPDERYDTFAVMHPRGRGSEWGIDLPNGTYSVHVVAGDPSSKSGRYEIAANGVMVLDGRATRQQPWVEGTLQVTVTDGRLTLTDPFKGHVAKIDFVDITPAPGSPTPPASPPPPSPTGTLQLHWQSAASDPVARLEASAVTVGNKLYVFGGYNVSSPNYLATKEMDAFDPATNTWTRLADLPQPLSHMGTATDGRYIYVAGGYVSDYSTGYQTFATSNTWRYDTQTNTWSAFVPLPAARGAGGMVLLNNQLHYVDGVNVNRVGQTTHWVLDLGAANPQWTVSTPLPFTRNHINTAVLDGKIYVIGGQPANDDFAPDADVLSWDPNNPSAWQRVASLPQPRSHATAVVADGKILVLGGVTTGNYVILSSVVAYDPSTDTWSTISDPLPAARLAPAAGVVDGLLVFTSGADSLPRANTWESPLPS